MTPLDTARDYLRLGLAIVPVPAGLKHAILENWHPCQFDIADLDCKGNLALRLGRCSGNLVDIDLDCREALALADLYLPPTGAEFGRGSLLMRSRRSRPGQMEILGSVASEAERWSRAASREGLAIIGHRGMTAQVSLTGVIDDRARDRRRFRKCSAERQGLALPLPAMRSQ